MKSLNRAMLIAVLVLVAIVSAACGGGSGGGSGKPEDAVKNWMTALFAGDGATVRNNTCDAQKAGITDELVNQMKSAYSASGATVDISPLTYTYDSTAKTVTVGGNIKVTISGVSTDAPVPFPPFPVVEEGGGWKVCAPMGG